MHERGEERKEKRKRRKIGEREVNDKEWMKDDWKRRKWELFASENSSSEFLTVVNLLWEQSFTISHCIKLKKNYL